jgi:hypothetical protein
MQTPSTNKAADYRQQAREARERAAQLSMSDARAGCAPSRGVALSV